MSLPVVASVLLAALVVVAACGPDVTSLAGRRPARHRRRPTGEPASPSVSPAAPSLIDLQVVVDTVTSPVDVAWRPSPLVLMASGGASAPHDLFVVEQAGTIRIVRDGAAGRRSRSSTSRAACTRRWRAGPARSGVPARAHPDDRRFFVYYTALDGCAGPRVVRDHAPKPRPSRSGDRADHPRDARPVRQPQRRQPRVRPRRLSSTSAPATAVVAVTRSGSGRASAPCWPRSSASTSSRRRSRTTSRTASRRTTRSSTTPGARPEIFVTGLRNPWRFRFDRRRGDLWIGDVGQGAWEEVDVVRAGQRSRLRLEQDGRLALLRAERPTATRPASRCRSPSTATTRAARSPAATVYRGRDVPRLVGQYLFSDYCSGRVWSIPTAGDGPREPRVGLESGRNISAIAAAPRRRAVRHRPRPAPCCGWSARPVADGHRHRDLGRAGLHRVSTHRRGEHRSAFMRGPGGTQRATLGDVATRR